MKYVALLLESGHTVFTYDFLQDILWIGNKNTLKGIVKSLLKSKVLVAIHPWYRGLPGFDQYEFASKLKSPSYITCETVLQQEAVIFQDYSSECTLVWTNTVTVDIEDYQYRFRKMKLEILLDPLGVHKTQAKQIASKERAICDMLYYVPNYYFDNIGSIDIELMEKLSQIYPKITQRSIYLLIQDAQNEES